MNKIGHKIKQNFKVIKILQIIVKFFKVFRIIKPNMSQEYEIGDASGEVEISEGEMDELGIEEIQNWRKCSKCNRPCSGHEGSTGQKCELNILTTQEEFSTYYSELKEKLKGKKKQKTKKTPRKQFAPTTSVADL